MSKLEREKLSATVSAEFSMYLYERYLFNF